MSSRQGNPVFVAYLVHILLLSLLILDIVSSWNRFPSFRQLLFVSAISGWVAVASFAIILVRDRAAFLSTVAGPLLTFYCLGVCLPGFELVTRAVLRARTVEPPVQFTPGSIHYVLNEAVVGASQDPVVTINKWGLRGPEPPTASEAYTIITVGGSTTNCWLLDDRRTWPYLLMQELNGAGPSRPIWVGNAGWDGHSTVEHLEALRRYPVYRHADLLLFLTGVNDVGQTVEFEGKPTQEFMEKNSHILFDELPPRPYVKRLRVVHLAVSLFNRFWSGHTTVDTGLSESRARRATGHRLPLPDLRTGVAEYRLRIKRLGDQCRAMGKRCFFMTQPALWRKGLSPAEEATLWFGWVGNFASPKGFLSSEDMQRAMDAFNAGLLDTCREGGLVCFDLASAVPKDSTLFFDDAHFSEAGATYVSRIASQWLRGSGLITELTPASVTGAARKGTDDRRF